MRLEIANFDGLQLQSNTYFTNASLCTSYFPNFLQFLYKMDDFKWKIVASNCFFFCFFPNGSIGGLCIGGLYLGALYIWGGGIYAKIITLQFKAPDIQPPPGGLVWVWVWSLPKVTEATQRSLISSPNIKLPPDGLEIPWKYNAGGIYIWG